MLLKVFTKKLFKMREFGSVEDPLNMHRTASNETVLVSEIPGIFNDEKFIIALGQGQKPASFLSDEFCKEQGFPYLPPKGRLGYKALRDIPISPARYFHQMLLNFNQDFASDVNYVFVASSVYEQHHLHSIIHFAAHKIKPNTLTSGIVKSIFKDKIERFVPRENAFSFMISVKEMPAY